MAVTSLALKPAVFLDKDGTLIEDVPYNVDADRIRIYPEVARVLSELTRQGYKIIVISNQPGIAHGYFDAAAVENAANIIAGRLAEQGVSVSGIYYCPHHPDGAVPAYRRNCECRKPRPGLLVKAAREQGVDLGSSWMIGDILNDVEAGNRAGCRTILVDRGNETEWVSGIWRQPDWVVGNLDGALKHMKEHFQ